MFSSCFTITNAAALEKTIAAWGLTSNLVMDIPTSGAKVFTFFMAGADPLTPPPFTFEELCVIKLYDAGGNVVFQFKGRRTKEEDAAVIGRTGITVTFKDRFYDLEKLPFKQLWSQGAAGNLEITRVFLFQDPTQVAPGADFHVTFAQQVAAIITFAAIKGVDLQAGIIDNNQVMPWYAARGLSCLQALETCQKFFPNMRMWIDDSTTPPSFNCRFQNNLAETQMQWAGNDAAGRRHLSSRISPLEELQATCVQLHYQENDSVNGATVTAWQIATFPANATGDTLRSIVVPIDLRGGSEKDSIGPVVAAAFNVTSLDYWRGNNATGQIGKFPHLGDANISNLAFTKDANGNLIPIVVTDKAGNLIDLAVYPNEHKSGSVFNWMALANVGPAVNLIEAQIHVHLSYTRTSTVGTGNVPVTEKAPKDHVHTVNIKLTNSPVGTTYYSALTSFDTAESPIAGLEQAIYNDRALLQHEGTHEIVETNAYTTPIVGPWNVLTLLGGRAAWNKMGIASVRIEFFANPNAPFNAWRNTTITLGPAKHLSPQDFNQYLQLFRGQVKSDSAAQRLNGSPGTSLDIGGDQAKQDSTPAAPQNGYETYTAPDATTPANTNQFTHDPANQTITFTQYNPAGGVNTSTKLPRVFSAQGAPAGNNNTLIAGIQYQAGVDLYFDATDPLNPVEYLCTTGGNKDASKWAKVAGGGGGNNWRGIWQPGTAYNLLDEVQVGNGMGAGTYISLIPANSNAPTSGIGWLQVSSVATWF